MDIKRIDEFNSEFAQHCWEIKEDISEEQNLLNQNKDFFMHTYHHGNCLVLFDKEQPVGFSIMRGRDYLALLGVKPEKQSLNFGTVLLDELKDEYDNIKCHTRVSNTVAVQFYKNNGFNDIGNEYDYYENGEDAVILSYSSSSESDFI